MSSHRKLDIAPLATAAAAGDSAAWDQLVIQVTPLLRRAAGGFRLRREDVDDVVQITWMQAFTHLHTLRAPEALVGWLMVTARREALRVLQRGVNEIITDDVVALDTADPFTVEDEIFERERETVVRSAIERLPTRQRTLLRHMLSAPSARYGEVAEVLEMPVGSIGPTRERALARLRDDRRVASLAAA